MTERHHLVPQFYLKRFADGKKQLEVLDRATGSSERVAVKRAVAEMDAYAIASPGRPV